MAIESKRGCGFRKVGGLYLMGDKGGRPCGRMPLPLEVCPACGEGIKQSRGWTWINPSKLFAETRCKRPLSLDLVMSFLTGNHAATCLTCPLRELDTWERAGLLWIGSGFYPTPGHFIQEANEQGISKRLNAVPRGFELGVDWVFLAHPLVIPRLVDGEQVMGPGVFRVFKPTRIEKVVTQSQAQDEEEMAKLQKQGITPFVVPDDDPDHNPGGQS